MIQLRQSSACACLINSCCLHISFLLYSCCFLSQPQTDYNAIRLHLRGLIHCAPPNWTSNPDKWANVTGNGTNCMQFHTECISYMDHTHGINGPGRQTV